MKITEIIKQDKKTISFEVFPPKRNTNFETVREDALKVASLKPVFTSVTYGAGGGTSEYTINIASDIQQNFNVASMAHLTCISSNHIEINEQLNKIQQAGIDNIMALRGDVPEEMKGTDLNKRDYVHAIDLIRVIRQNGYDFCLGGACYPEGHPESKNQEEDLKHLKEKAEAGLDFLTTQMFFDNQLFYNFVDKAKQIGINVPIFPGIMPITNIKQINRIKTLSNAYLPDDLLNLVDQYNDDPIIMKQKGIEYATKQIIDLYNNGVKNVHLYTMNNPEVASTIKNNISSIID